MITNIASSKVSWSQHNTNTMNILNDCCNARNMLFWLYWISETNAHVEEENKWFINKPQVSFLLPTKRGIQKNMFYN